MSENELPMAHVLAGVQAACLLELFLRLSDKSGTQNALLMESSRPPHLACAWQNKCLPGPEGSDQHSYLRHLSRFHVGSPGTQGGERCTLHETGDQRGGESV